MLARVRWLGTGVVIGAGGSLWARQALRRRLRRTDPVTVARRAARTALQGAAALGRPERRTSAG